MIQVQGSPGVVDELGRYLGNAAEEFQAHLSVLSGRYFQLPLGRQGHPVVNQLRGHIGGQFPETEGFQHFPGGNFCRVGQVGDGINIGIDGIVIAFLDHRPQALGIAEGIRDVVSGGISGKTEGDLGFRGRGGQ